MAETRDFAALADWRRQVHELYAVIRQTPAAEQANAWDTFRSTRDHLFRNHSQSPLSLEQRKTFSGLAYYPFNPDWRVVGTIDRNVVPDTTQINLGKDGLMRLTRVASVRFTLLEHDASLSLFWIEGYGGGLFLPFKDATNGQTTYGGGRYLYDTIYRTFRVQKGA